MASKAPPPLRVVTYDPKTQQSKEEIIDFGGTPASRGPFGFSSSPETFGRQVQALNSYSRSKNQRRLDAIERLYPAFALAAMTTALGAIAYDKLKKKSNKHDRRKDPVSVRRKKKDRRLHRHRHEKATDLPAA